MAKLTRTQARYIEEKFACVVREQVKVIEKKLGKEFQIKEKELLDAVKKKYPEFKNKGSLLAAIAAYSLQEQFGASHSWGYVRNEIHKFEATSQKLKDELHESLLFCDGTLETAQSIINNFTVKLKEIK